MYEARPAHDDVTEDRLLGGQLVLRQPRSGFRVAIDTVLLAAAVPAREGESVFEPGAGCGGAALCLARRTGCFVVGVEMQADLAALANDNARRNGLADRVEVLEGAVGETRPRGVGPFDDRLFDHAMANPPHHQASSGTPSPDAAKAAANVESGGALDLWIAAMLAALKPGGTLTLIHRADRLDHVIGALAGRAGGLTVFPLWPKAGAAASRVIVRARKGARTPLSLAAGLVLHRPDGRYTDQADAVLRGAALDF